MVGSPMAPLVYKIVSMAEWRAARIAGRYSGSPDDLRDGFIHFSTAAQLAGTLRKFFAGQSNLALLEVRCSDLGDQLCWEAARSGTLYPHLYASLQAAAVVREWPLTLDAEGHHILPPDLA